MMALFENYTFTLETVSPLRIGNGEKIDRKQYYMTEAGQTILMFDQRKLIKLLLKKGKLDEYSEAIQKGITLDQFFHQNSRYISVRELEEAVLYRLPVYDRLGGKYLHLFQKDCNGQPYIPGSSLKGAIITALFAVYYEELFPEEQRTAYENAIWQLVQSYDGNGRAVFQAEDLKSLKNSLLQAMGILIPNISDEHVPEKQKEILNFLRAIRISDSESVDRTQLAACGKADAFIKPKKDRSGIAMNEKNPGILHESLIPGTEVRFRLSIDCGCLNRFRKGMKAEECIEWIRDALNTFRKQQDFYFTDMFFARSSRTDYPERNRMLADKIDKKQDHFYFGAGTGFVNKTLVYPILWGDDDDEETIKRTIGFVAGFLDMQFGKNKHQHDVDWSVSPHKLKCVYYEDERYLMGHCAFSIKPDRDARKLR